MLLIARMIGDSIYIGDEIEIKVLGMGKLTNQEALKHGEYPVIDSSVEMFPSEMHANIGISAPRSYHIKRFLK